MNDIIKIIDNMDPEEATVQIGAALKRLLPLLDEEARNRFVMDILGETEDDKVSSLVHL